MGRRSRLTILLAALCSFYAAAQNLPIETPEPPAAEPVVDDYFGTKIEDPYRYFENLQDPRVRAYFRQQGEYAAKHLRALPFRGQLLKETLAANQAATEVASLQPAGERWFYLKTEANEAAQRVYVRDRLAGKERMLFDPATLDTATEKYAITAMVPSPDGRHVVLGLAANDAEIGELRVLDVQQGALLPERIDRTGWAGPSWLPDGKAFTYTRLRADFASVEESQRMAAKTVHLHRVGTPAEQDEVLFGPARERGLRLYDAGWPGVRHGRGGSQAVVEVSSVVRNDGYELYAVAQADLAHSDAKARRIVALEDRVSAMARHRDTLYLRSAVDAPRYKVLALDLAALDAARPLAGAVEVLPQSEGVVEELVCARDALYAHVFDGARSRLMRIEHGTHARSEIELPFPATLYAMEGDEAHDGVVFKLVSWVASPRYYAFRPGLDKPALLDLLPPSPVRFDDMVAVHAEAVSKDGTRVPLSIVRHRDTPLDGKRPTAMRGYGAYGISQRPMFWPFAKPLLDRHGVFAVCHVRGGGERGAQWHRDGQLADKHHSFEDFIACMEYLHANGYSSPETLAINGGSAGGILVGRVVTMRPDLMRAAVIDVPLADMLRMERQANGPNQVPEFGTVATREGFESLYAMSPYAHVRNGVQYPAVMVTTGMNDSRVAPWQAAKLAARLQVASSSERPVLLRVDEESGHGVTSGRDAFAEAIADHLAFVLSQIQGTE